MVTEDLSKVRGVLFEWQPLTRMSATNSFTVRLYFGWRSPHDQCNRWQLAIRNQQLLSFSVWQRTPFQNIWLQYNWHPYWPEKFFFHRHIESNWFNSFNKSSSPKLSTSQYTEFDRKELFTATGSQTGQFSDFHSADPNHYNIINATQSNLGEGAK